jgi:hypothetical protein
MSTEIARRAIRAWTPCANCPSRQHAACDRACRVGQIKTMLPRIPPHEEGRFAIVTNVGAGSGGRDGSRAFLTPTNELIRLREDCDGMVPTPSWTFSRKAFADGQAVWSWRPDAGAKSWSAQRALWDDGGKRARSPGRARSKPSTHRAGEGRVFPAEPVVPAPCIFIRTRGPRVSVDTRPSLRPLAIWRVLFPAKLGRHQPREHGPTPRSGAKKDWAV